MKNLKSLLCGLLLIGTVEYPLHGQSEFEQVIAELPSEPQLVAPEEVPVAGTFYMLSDFQDTDSPPPYPCNPFWPTSVYSTAADGIFIVDNSEAKPELFRAAANTEAFAFEIWARVQSLVHSVQQTRSAQWQTSSLDSGSSMMTTSSLDPGIPGEGDTNSVPNQITYNPPVYGSNDLWLQIVGVTNGAIYLVIHGTVADEQYEIQSRELLNTNIWTSEGSTILGTSNSTQVTLLMGTRTNQLFFRVKSWQDSEGSGLPDWWQWQWFGSLGVDPYGDEDVDGWNNLQEYQNGTDPNSFDTPPPAGNPIAILDESGKNLIYQWEHSPGPVSEYVIEGFFEGEIARLTAEQTSYTNNLDSIPLQIFAPYVRAVFTNGSTAYSYPLLISNKRFWTKAQMVRGPGGLFYLSLTSPSVDLSQVHLYSRDVNYRLTNVVSIPVSTFTNGVRAISSQLAEKFLFDGVWVRGSTSSGEWSGIPEDASTDKVFWSWPQTTPRHYEFLNASAHLKQNLQFLLRAGTVSHGFEYAGFTTNDYVASPYWSVDSDNFLPVSDNFLWRNFVYDAVDGTTNWATGAYYNVNQQSRALGNVKYYTNTYVNPPPAAFTWNGPRYFYHRDLVVPFDDASGFGELGLVTYSDGRVGMSSGVVNFYGLPINGVLILNGKGSWVVSPNQTIGPVATDQASHFFANVAPADLETISYYFDQTFRYGSAYPGDAWFTPSQTTPLFVMASGEASQFSGWAKQRINNGQFGKFAYLQQYFDAAYQVNSNGMTGDPTGLLSPYGEFLATEPGRVALVTMADIETGQRGTGLVQVVKIQFDMNRDGVMDLSLAGPDNTADDQRFVFWANNDVDRGHTVDGDDFEQDDLGTKDIKKLPAAEQVLDYAFTSNGLPAIPCTRDLEDYNRIWIPGLNSLMAALPANYTVQLATDYYPLRFFRAVEPDGGTDYLFDETTASNQVSRSAELYLGQVSHNAPLVLNGKINLGEHFIFCGLQSGDINLSIQVFDENGQFIGGATGHLRIRDIKEMYERWTVGERPAYPPESVAKLAANDLVSWDGTVFNYPANSDTNTPYILHVHGWNMETWEKDRFGESAFKRLYWQGYQGRFGIFRWPTYNDFPSLNQPLLTHFDKSEFNAWRSGAPLRKLLENLNAKYPGQVRLTAHSMGNVTAGEALRTNVTLAHTYVAMQSALAAHAYDASVTNRDMGLYGPSTPNRFAAFPASGMPCYFGSAAGASRYINFFNKDDWALGWWEVDQNLKPNEDAGYHYRTGQGGAEEYIRGHIFETSLYLPQDAVEIFAFIIEGQSLALGAQTNVDGVFRPNDEVDLRVTPFLFGDAHKGHSGQFRSSNMKRHVFWERTLQRMQLK